MDHAGCGGAEEHFGSSLQQPLESDSLLVITAAVF